MEKTLQLLGEKIRFLRKKQSLTQIALSEGICTQPYLSHIEKGQTSPSAYILSKLANRLGVDSTYFNVSPSDIIKEIEAMLSE